MTEPYFDLTDEGLAPRPHAHAPWGEDMQHGRLLGGLAARALEAELGSPGWRCGRLTVDLFRPAAMVPVEIEVRSVRDGRRIRVADALLRAGGHDVVRATAVFLAESEEPPGEIWRPTMEPWPDPEAMEGPVEEGAPGQPAWLFKLVRGGFETREQSRVWSNETAQLVAGEEVSPFVRAALSGDVACPLANASDEGLFYINADYTMLIGRYPVGPWIGLEVNQQLQADGVSMGSSTLVDRDGPFATSGGASLARPPLTAP
ncbi:MAG: thioesterase family protein [Actinomycetota bacterium]